jgi:hypothetical protein
MDKARIGIVSFLWGINLVLLAYYMIDEEVNAWNITALVGVALTGIVPMIFSRDGDKKREGCAAFLHVISGVIGAAGSGLALGYAAQCDKTGRLLDLLLYSALVCAINGVVAHILLIEPPTKDRDGWKVAGSSFLPRIFWFAFICLCSIICLIGHVVVITGDDDYETTCKHEDDYMAYLISPIVHVVAFGILSYLGYNEMLHPYISYSIFNVAGVLSMFGAMITHGYWGDILLTTVVYLYLALAHLLK